MARRRGSWVVGGSRGSWVRAGKSRRYQENAPKSLKELVHDILSYFEHRQNYR